MLALSHACASLTLVLFRFDPLISVFSAGADRALLRLRSYVTRLDTACALVCAQARQPRRSTVRSITNAPCSAYCLCVSHSLVYLLSLLSVHLSISSDISLSRSPACSRTLISLSSAYTSCVSPLSVCVPLTALPLSLPSPLAACVPLLPLTRLSSHCMFASHYFSHIFCSIHRLPLTVCCVLLFVLSPSHV